MAVGIALGVLLVLVALSLTHVSDRCAPLRELLNEGLLEQAKQGYLKVLKDAPSNGCAQEGLRAIAESRCDSADALLARGLVQQAQKAYVAVLEDKDSPRDRTPIGTCAHAGLRRTAAKRCRFIEELEGNPEIARKAFEAILGEGAEGANPAGCAVEGLNKYPSPSPSP